MNNKSVDLETKVLVVIFSGILILFCIAAFAYYLSTLKRPAPPAQILSLLTPEKLTRPGTKIYLPAIAFSLSFEPPVESNALAVELPTEIPENLWRVTNIDSLAYSLRGILYDLGSFENVSTGQAIKGFCANPGRPAPQLGDLFIRNTWNVLIPIKNPDDNQRFIQISP